MIEVPETKDFLTNITGLKDVATTIALTAKQDTIVVTKSNVPDGTNGRLRQIIDHNKLYHINNEMDSNLKEDSIICDQYYIYQIGNRTSSDSSLIDKFRSLYITISKIYNYITGRQMSSPSKVVGGKF